MCLANTNNTTFSFFSSKVNQEEMILLNSNSIDSFQDLLSNVALESPHDNGNPISHYDGILSTNIINPNSIVILFPKNTTQFRFYSSTTMPYGDRNRGRIVLDNMHIQYH